MTRRELAHGSRAEEHSALVGQPIEDAARQLHRRGGDRHSFLRDAGFAAHPLRDRKRLVKAAVQHLSGGSGRCVLLLQLPQDLRLTHHHRVETRGDAKQVADRLPVGVGVEVGRQRRLGEVVLPGEKARQQGA